MEKGKERTVFRQMMRYRQKRVMFVKALILLKLFWLHKVLRESRGGTFLREICGS